MGILLLTGFVHILAKLFGSEGTFQKFFVVYIAYNARPFIIAVTLLLAWTIFEIKAALFLYAFFFLLFVPITAAIKTNYRFNWPESFFIDLFVQSVLLLSSAALFFMLNPSIISG